MRTIIPILLSMFFTSISFAQEKFKFGDVPKEDLNMTAYPTDTSAVAAVLYEYCDVNYRIGSNDFELVKEYTVRIKVLKSGGLEYADINIPFNSASDEKVEGISGNVFNLAGEKVERTKLSKDNIFEEKTSDTWRRKKISFPNVKVGSVFELKYRLVSPNHTYLKDFVFQAPIPVRYSCYEVIVPEYFKFSKKVMGYEPVNYSQSKENLFFLIGQSRLSCIGNKMKFETVNLPPMKQDEFVWNVSDYISKVKFDFTQISIPGSIYKNFWYC